MSSELYDQFAASVTRPISIAAPIRFRCAEEYGDGVEPYRVPQRLQHAFSAGLATLAKEVRLVRCKSTDEDCFPKVSGKKVGSFLILSRTESPESKRLVSWDPRFSLVALVELASLFRSGLLRHCFDPAPLLNPGTLCPPVFRLAKSRTKAGEAWVHLYRGDEFDIPHLYLWVCPTRLAAVFRQSIDAATLTDGFKTAARISLNERSKEKTA
jgi:hypothetical protein